MGFAIRLVNGLVFFFSSRRRHTRFDCDWSSDVCSSDLFLTAPHPQERLFARTKARSRRASKRLDFSPNRWSNSRMRSEERRVGKEGRSRWSPYHLKKKIISTQRSPSL